MNCKMKSGGIKIKIKQTKLKRPTFLKLFTILYSRVKGKKLKKNFALKYIIVKINEIVHLKIVLHIT